VTQHLNDGRWRVRLEGFPDVTTDELTLDDIETVEKVAGVPWVMVNPLASAKEAKGLLTILLMRAGIPENEALKAAGRTPLRKLAGAFAFELPDRQPATVLSGNGGPPDPPSSAPTSAGG
jgi:hypothetical protein